MKEPNLSDFLRRSGDIVRGAEDRDVVLRRRDGPDLVLSTRDRVTGVSAALDVLGRLVLSLVADAPAAVAKAIDRTSPWLARLAPDDQLRCADEIGRAAVEAAELGTTSQVAEVVHGWREAARSTGGVRSGFEARPVSIPDDVDDPHQEKASGVVDLPIHVRWSGPARSYDMRDPTQLRLVYEQVLQEGTEDDVRRFIEIDTLIEHWDHLVLPQRVRRAWGRWLRARRGIDVAC